MLLFPPLARRVLPANHALPQQSDSPRAVSSSIWRANRVAMRGGDDVATARGRENLERVAALLREGALFDAFGVLERWNETCELIGRYFPWLKVECDTHKNARSVSNKKRHQLETPQTLRPELRAMIEEMNAADVLLYEAGRKQFDEQLREAGMA